MAETSSPVPPAILMQRNADLPQRMASDLGIKGIRDYGRAL
jgi:hypothetical protein